MQGTKGRILNVPLTQDYRNEWTVRKKKQREKKTHMGGTWDRWTRT